MNRRLRRPSQSHKLLAEEERYLRYLKPGALAKLRDSKISARSHRSTESSHFHQIYLYSTPSPPSPSQIDGGYLCFSGRIYGPRCPQRKKLCAPNIDIGFHTLLRAVDWFASNHNSFPGQFDGYTRYQFQFFHISPGKVIRLDSPGKVFGWLAANTWVGHDVKLC